MSANKIPNIVPDYPRTGWKPRRQGPTKWNNQAAAKPYARPVASIGFGQHETINLPGRNLTSITNAAIFPQTTNPADLLNLFGNQKLAPQFLHITDPHLTSQFCATSPHPLNILLNTAIPLYLATIELLPTLGRPNAVEVTGTAVMLGTLYISSEAGRIVRDLHESLFLGKVADLVYIFGMHPLAP